MGDGDRYRRRSRSGERSSSRRRSRSGERYSSSSKHRSSRDHDDRRGSSSHSRPRDREDYIESSSSRRRERSINEDSEDENEEERSRGKKRVRRGEEEGARGESMEGDISREVSSSRGVTVPSSVVDLLVKESAIVTGPLVTSSDRKAAPMLTNTVSSSSDVPDNDAEESKAEKLRKRREKMKLWESQQKAKEFSDALPINTATVTANKGPVSTLTMKSTTSKGLVMKKATPSSKSMSSLFLPFGNGDEDEGEVKEKHVSKVGALLAANLFTASTPPSTDAPVISTTMDIVKEEEEGEDALDAFMSTVGPSPSLATISMDDIMKVDVQQEGDVDDNVEGDDNTYYLEFKAALQRQKEEEAKLMENEKKEEGGVPVDVDDYGEEEEDHIATMYAYGEEQSSSALDILREKMKKKELRKVDHNAMDYPRFRKVFYIESPVIANMSEEEVVALREEKAVKIRGKKCPRPVSTWQQCGLSDRILHVLKKNKLESPFAIQAQAIPCIMSGRDVIGIAKTGSGKTLAFLLPLLRHVEDQRPVADGEGPIGLIMAPARELAVQIYNQTRMFTRVLTSVRATAVYGGAPVSEQIASLKRGSEIIICTPGRMIDILTMNAGRLISLARVTFIVLDEADRMFDMGFEPQITMIIDNIRPQRQTVMFSATFPSHVERLARKILKTPVEITVGGRSEVAGEIEQIVEVREEGDKFPRLLQLLGLWYDKGGSILIFVDTQMRCDQLFKDLSDKGYPCLSLHGGKDQADRDQTIADFKNHFRTIMVATSVAGRGLDVKELNLVINYNCPNHLEDYVHRVGRTGRAGNKGTAITFITPAEDRYAGDIVKALTASGGVVPPELQALQDEFQRKLQAGEANRGFNQYIHTSGHKFDDSEAEKVAKIKDVQRKQIELDAGFIDINDLVEDKGEEGKGDEEEEDEEGETTSAAVDVALEEKKAKAAAYEQKKRDEYEKQKEAKMTPVELAKYRAMKAASIISRAPALSALSAPPLPTPPIGGAENKAIQAAIEAAKMAGKAMGINVEGGAVQGGEVGGGGSGHHMKELEINEYPQKARWQVLKKETLDRINEFTAAAMTTKGSYIPPGRNPGPGERKLYVLVEGPTERSVIEASNELIRLLEEETLKIGYDPKQMQYGKYSVA